MNNNPGYGYVPVHNHIQGTSVFVRTPVFVRTSGPIQTILTQPTSASVFTNPYVVPFGLNHPSGNVNPMGLPYAHPVTYPQPIFQHVPTSSGMFQAHAPIPNDLLVDKSSLANEKEKGEEGLSEVDKYSECEITKSNANSVLSTEGDAQTILSLCEPSNEEYIPQPSVAESVQLVPPRFEKSHTQNSPLYESHSKTKTPPLNLLKQTYLPTSLIDGNETRVEFSNSDMDISDTNSSIISDNMLERKQTLITDTNKYARKCIDNEMSATKAKSFSRSVSPQHSPKKSKKKKRKKRKAKSKTAVNQTPLKKCYYIRSDTSKHYAKATPSLMDLQLKFVEFFKHFQSTDWRTEVHENVPHNNTKHSCKCTAESLKKGIHHNIYPGNEVINECNFYTNNADVLHHYKLVIESTDNFISNRPTTIYYDGNEYHFDGFSLFSHSLLDEMPAYTFKRNMFEYKVTWIKQDTVPQTFCVKDLELVSKYLFHHIFELYDWEFSPNEGCPLVHFMLRFVSNSLDTEGDLLPMAELIKYLLESFSSFYDSEEDWSVLVKANKGCIVTNNAKKPRSLRCDNVVDDKDKEPPDFVHSTTLRNSSVELLKEYRSAIDRLSKIKKKVRGRLNDCSKEEKQELLTLQNNVDQMKEQRKKKADLKDIRVSSDGYFHTGLRWEIFQHASYLHGLCKHFKFMLSLKELEKNILYTFKDKSLLKAAVTLPSYLDQTSMSQCMKNSIYNLGKKAPEFNTSIQQNQPNRRKKGSTNMMNIMTTLFDDNPTKSDCLHNERMEFLGDAILDYLTSLHLFLMFPDKGAGRLSQFRTGIVQTENLTQISQNINLEDFLLINHKLRSTYEREQGVQTMDHHLANAVEAIIGAVYLDGGLNAVDTLLSTLLFSDDDSLASIWKNPKTHPLQVENPGGDRHMIKDSLILQKICKFETSIGVKFKNIRLLAKAFTHSTAGLSDAKLTGGNYDRLEFLGDAILKFVTSDYLYKHFPNHQEGHLTLLRMSLVNAKCLTSAAFDLCINDYIIFESARSATTVKEKVQSDVYEAFLGALHIDRRSKGVRYCQKMIEVSILSRLKEFILNQEWLEPKAQLLHCCSVSAVEHSDEEPEYRSECTVKKNGVRVYEANVFFQGQQLGSGTGRTLKDAEKEAAKDALTKNHFEHHDRQKRLIYKKYGPVAENSREQMCKEIKRKNTSSELSEAGSKKRKTSSSSESFLQEPYEWGS